MLLPRKEWQGTATKNYNNNKDLDAILMQIKLRYEGKLRALEDVVERELNKEDGEGCINYLEDEDIELLKPNSLFLKEKLNSLKDQ